jgi:hypothetical protein
VYRNASCCAARVKQTAYFYPLGRITKKLKAIFAFSVCGLLACLFTARLVQSRFWDSKRVEKAVQADIPTGSSEQFVLKWLSQSGISYRKITNTGNTFSRQTVVQASRINPKRISTLIIGSTREGLTPDDLYKVDVCFFFDKQGKLIKYDFHKMWDGL